MRPGETVANKKRIYFDLFDVDGLPCSGETDEGAVFVVGASTEIQVNRDLAGFTDAVGSFAHNGDGEYYYEFDDAEIAGTTEGTIIFRVKRAGVIRTQRVRVPLSLVAVSSIDTGTITFDDFDNIALVMLSKGIYTGLSSGTSDATHIHMPGAGAVDIFTGGMIMVLSGTGIGGFGMVSSYNTGTEIATLYSPGVAVPPDGTSQIFVTASTGATAGAVTIGAGSLTPESFSDDAKRLLFGIIFNGFVSDFADAQVTIFDETPAQDHIYRGCLFHVWKEQGEGQTWVIADSVGNVLTLVGGDAWPVDLVLQDVEDGIPSKVCIIRFGESIGTLFVESETERTNGRQVVKGMKHAMFMTDGTNIGQPTVGVDAVYKDEAGNVALESDIDVTGAKTTTWTKGAP